MPTGKEVMRVWIVTLLRWALDRLSPARPASFDPAPDLVLPCLKVKPFDWGREYRRVWHHAPFASWLEPEPSDVRAMIAPHLHRQDQIGTLLRRLEPVITADRTALDPTMERELVAIIARVSKALDKVRSS